MKRPFARRSAASLLMLFIAFHAVPARADLEQEMNDLFGSISNVTNGQAHLGARRGVVSAGSIYIRNQNVNVRPFQTNMPRIDAGCGGIDFFGGSFSFINSEQLIQLGRSIAANATGYAFKVAINALSPTIGGLMSELEAKIQAMNDLAWNSCTAAQKLVDESGLQGAADALAQKLKGSTAPGEAVAGGQSVDAKDSFTGFLQQTNSVTSQMTAAGYNELYRKGGFGNLTWRVLNETPDGPFNGLAAWFTHGDTQFLNALLSYMGTVTVVAPVPTGDTTSPGAISDITPRVSPPTITIRDLYEGNTNVQGDSVSTLVLYQCPPYDVADVANNPEGACMGAQAAPKVGEIQQDSSALLTGLRTRVERLLLGDGQGNIGLVQKLSIQRDQALSPEEIAFIEYYPTLATELRNVAVGNPGASAEFARQAATPFAIAVLQDLHNNLTFAIRTAAASNPQIQGMGTVLKSLEQRDAEASAFFEELRSNTVSRTSLSALAASYRANSIRPENFMRPSTPPPAGGSNTGTTPSTP